jgi:hypothetical protein
MNAYLFFGEKIGVSSVTKKLPKETNRPMGEN